MESISAINSASDIQMDYMNLLVTELQYQNPLEPLDNKEMAAQLAQFSQLQQLETTNNNFEKVLVCVEKAYAGSLLGKEISFLSETETGASETNAGKVEQVLNGVNGDVSLIVNDQSVSLNEIVSVKE